ncbi:hypothetical protein CHARACLAT_020849 [Characodon lateralis]|uniref:Uncharacterized protein n=1 Tax=Characodon lateralis TaxID=208331 RepID=A0ABU7F790_9TELE|nr:hypothetical protein [Characodon lateralis]
MLLQQQNGQPTHGCLSNRPIPTFMGVAANGTPPIAPIKLTGPDLEDPRPLTLTAVQQRRLEAKHPQQRK